MLGFLLSRPLHRWRHHHVLQHRAHILRLIPRTPALLISNPAHQHRHAVRRHALGHRTNRQYRRGANHHPCHNRVVPAVVIVIRRWWRRHRSRRRHGPGTWSRPWWIRLRTRRMRPRPRSGPRRHRARRWRLRPWRNLMLHASTALARPHAHIVRLKHLRARPAPRLPGLRYGAQRHQHRQDSARCSFRSELAHLPHGCASTVAAGWRGANVTGWALDGGIKLNVAASKVGLRFQCKRTLCCGRASSLRSVITT